MAVAAVAATRRWGQLAEPPNTGPGPIKPSPRVWSARAQGEVHTGWHAAAERQALGVLAITRRRPCLTGATMATGSSLCVVVCLGLAILGTTALAAPVAPTSVHVTGGDARLTVEWEWPHAAAVTEFHINATTVDLNPPPGRNTLHREPHLVVIPTDPYTCAPRLAAVVPGLSNGARYAVSVVRGHDMLLGAVLAVLPLCVARPDNTCARDYSEPSSAIRLEPLRLPA